MLRIRERVENGKTKLLVQKCKLINMYAQNLKSYFYDMLSPPSVPDLSEYRVWLGISHLNESGENDFHRQERRISHVICGPEGSSLALLRLTQ